MVRVNSLLASNGSQSRRIHFAGHYLELYEAHRAVMKNEMRLWLLKSLLEKNLATRDIYYFAKNQAKLRTFDQVPNPGTMKTAMNVKITDMKKVLSHSVRDRTNKRAHLLNELNHRSFKLRKKVRLMKTDISKEREIIQLKYKKKINHYLQIQNPEPKVTVGPKDFSPTVPPRNLNEFESLPIFRHPRDLPKPKPPWVLLCVQKV